MSKSQTGGNHRIESSTAKADVSALSLASNDSPTQLLLEKPSKSSNSTFRIIIIITVSILTLLSSLLITAYYLNWWPFETKEDNLSDSPFTIKQPPQIRIKHNGNFVLHVDYCNFKISDNSTTILDINTRCYCWDYTESSDIEIVSINSDNIQHKDILNGIYLCDIPGPTLIIQNDMDFNITLINNMSGISFNLEHDPIIIRSWPDVTNLHTHGLHIDPAWDDVFKALNPGETHRLHYKIPANHYPGTHWYHPHFHGSTNFQVHGGMFGALIMESNEDKNDIYNDNNIDMIDIILHLHYIYSYTNCECSNKTEPELQNEYTYTMQSADPWTIDSLCYDWCVNDIQQRANSGFIYHFVSDIANMSTGFLDVILLNGQFEPKMDIVSNQWYRLRIINSNGMYYTQISFENFLFNNLCVVYLIANDGIFFNQSRNIKNKPYYNETILPPGARADIAIKCRFEENNSKLLPVQYSMNMVVPELGFVPRFIHDTPIFYVNIYENHDEDMNAEIDDTFPFIIPEYPEYLTIDENEENELLTDYCPCYTFLNSSDDLSCQWYFGGPPKNGRNHDINGIIFNHSKPLLYVCSNKIYEFSVESTHPFHIHNSPFQILKDIPYHNISDVEHNGFFSQYGDWRDTIAAVDDDNTFKIRYSTQHFDGPIVFHCHFLPHEDEGMLGYFQVVDCDDDSTNINDLNPFQYNPINDVPDQCDIVF